MGYLKQYFMLSFPSENQLLRQNCFVPFQSDIIEQAKENVTLVVTEQSRRPREYVKVNISYFIIKQFFIKL